MPVATSRFLVPSPDDNRLVLGEPEFKALLEQFLADALSKRLVPHKLNVWVHKVRDNLFSVTIQSNDADKISLDYADLPSTLTYEKTDE